MAPTKILITGATGYIGGTILAKLLEPASGITTPHSISVLIRGEKQITTFDQIGVTPILFEGLDQTDQIKKIASEHDIVINTASSQNTAAAKAFIEGLGERKAATGNRVHYLHTSGTSCLADQPITGAYHETRVFSDADDIYAYMKERQALQVYSQRTTDIAIIESSTSVAVPATLIMSPTIYSLGTGPFNKLSVQIPAQTRSAIKAGQAEVVGEGKGVWDFVHVQDLADLYLIVVKRILAGEEVPTGEKGVIFSSSGRYSFLQAAQAVGKALLQLGVIKTDEVKSISLKEAADRWTGGDQLTAELAYASNSRTDSVVGKALGWKPVHTEQEFWNHFLEEAKIIIGNQ